MRSTELKGIFMSEDIVSRAKALAHRAHAGQVDKAGRPYIEHVARVAAQVRKPHCCDNQGCNEHEEAAAWLHDVLEDAPSFAHELREFPGPVYFAVRRLTRLVGCSEHEYYSGIVGNRIALRVKLADIADNSSEERLALLDNKTAARLRRKYAKAIKALTE